MNRRVPCDSGIVDEERHGGCGRSINPDVVKLVAASHIIIQSLMPSWPHGARIHA